MRTRNDREARVYSCSLIETISIGEVEMYHRVMVNVKAMILAPQATSGAIESQALKHRHSRRIIMRSLLLALAALFIFVGIGRFNSALAQSPVQVPPSAEQPDKTPLGSMLKPDGTLKVDGTFSGSLDPQGWSMVSEPGKGPRFVPSGSKSSETPLTPGDENWDDRFVPPGTDASILAIALSGNGDLYVGGTFLKAGGVPANRIAKWNGSTWSALGTGTDDWVNALVIDGSNVYAAGKFIHAGGVTVNHVAKWNGSIWSALGTGTNNDVNALSISFDGKVFAGGTFTSPGSRIAMWDGSTWSALGTGTDGPVNVIATQGLTLFVGGSFTNAGGAGANRIAQWDGTSWNPVGSGTDGPVYAIAITASYVYVGGTFGTAGGVTAHNIARFNNTTWFALGSGANATVNSITTSGTNVYAGGSFTSPATRIARWDGTVWSAMGSGTTATVQGMVVSGSNLYAAGQFILAGGVTAIYTSKWDGSAWSALGKAPNNNVYTIAISDGNVYIGGAFVTAGGVTVNHIAMWDGTSWRALGSGTDGTVYAMAAVDGNIYVGGSFNNAGGSPASNIAMWNGSAWSALGSGTNGVVYTIAIDGANVYAGGSFTSPGSRIAMWDGTSWQSVGTGTSGLVSGIAVGSDGVYVVGAFQNAGGSPAAYVARWNGAWTTLGTGLGGAATALAIYGSNVYVVGHFGTAGGNPANNIAVWNGAAWAPLGAGIDDDPNSIIVTSSDIYVGGSFTIPASHIARWDGSAWQSLGSGTDATVATLGINGGDLYVGGTFGKAGGKRSAYVGVWYPQGQPTQTPTATTTITPISSPSPSPTPSSTPGCGIAWNIVSSPNPGSIYNELDGVAVVSANDVWAVGTYYDGTAFQTLAEHWNGTAWVIVATPNAGSSNSALLSVTAVSANDVWAVGYYFGNSIIDQTLIQHWDGIAWTNAPSPFGGFSYNELDGIVAVSANDVWAVGSYYDGVGAYRTGVAHWNGTAWSIVPSPNAGSVYNELYGVAVVSANDVWAVGSYGDSLYTFQTLLEHWNGTAWSIVPSPNVGSGPNELKGVAVVSTNDVWAVGNYYNGATYQTLLEHWNGTTWSIVPSPNVGSDHNKLDGIAAVSANDVWAVGYYDSGTIAHDTLVEHWNGTSWVVVPSPNPGPGRNELKAMTAVSANIVWAVGRADQTLVERYADPCDSTCHIQFTDVAEGSTFYSYVRCLACGGIISGYACGGSGEPCDPNNDPYFRPNVTVNRGQLSKIVSNAAGFQNPAGAQLFQDVPVGSTFYDFIFRLATRGYINGYPCGGAGEPCGPGNLPYFRPGNTATRGQISKIVSNAAGFRDPAGAQRFQDVPSGYAFYDYISRLASRGIMSGYACGGAGEPCGVSNLPYFRPGNNATRGQTSKIVGGAFFPNCQTLRR
jgi:hypothetical protein